MRKEPWKSYVKELVRSFPELERRLDTPLDTRITAVYGSGDGGRAEGHYSNPVEAAVIHDLPPKDQRVYDAICKARHITLTMYRNGDLRMKLIDLVYWKKTCNIQGAAMRLHCHVNSAVKFNCDFLRLVARILDLP